MITSRTSRRGRCSLSFTVAPSFTVLNEEQAIMVVPLDAVKTEHRILKSKIPKEIQLTLVDQYPDLFCISNATENVTIKALTASDTEE